MGGNIALKIRQDLQISIVTNGSNDYLMEVYNDIIKEHRRFGTLCKSD